jgi:hypothetical protein
MAEKLFCGTGKVKITPPEELLPYMFGLIGQRYGKVHDDIFVRALCFKSGDKKALIVDFDLDKAPYPAEWTAEIEKATGIPADNILFLAIHTHTAPLTGYRPFEGPNFIERKPPEIQAKVKEYESFLFDRMMEAVNMAQELQPAKFGYAKGESHIGVNRCQVYHVKGENGEEYPKLGIGSDSSKICDPTLLVMKVENAETGAPIAVVTNYSVHCVAIFQNDYGEGKAVLSGDIGGNTEQNIEREFPGAVALWTSAPAGDINPVQMIQTIYPDYETGEDVEIHVKGEDALEGTLKAMVGRHTSDIFHVLRQVKCTIDEAEIKTGVQWTETMASTTDFIKNGGEPEYNNKYEIRLQRLQVGNLAFVGADGELYTSLGHAIKEASPVEDTFVINHNWSMLINNPGYVLDDPTLKLVTESHGGGVPGGKIYTAPGAVKEILIEGTKKLFE